MLPKSTIYQTLFCLFLACSLQSQNLVPNPSFENYIGALPCGWSPNFPSTMDSWDNPTAGTPDIFSTLVATSCYASCLSTDTDSDDSLMANAIDASFQWLDCNDGMSAVAGANNPGFMPDLNGSYAVSVTQNGCTAVSDCYDVIVLSATDLDEAERPSIYPNPTSSNAFISFDYTDVMNIIIYDGSGRKMLQTEVNQGGEIDLSSFPAGLYIVMIQTKEMTWTERVVKL